MRKPINSALAVAGWFALASLAVPGLQAVEMQVKANVPASIAARVHPPAKPPDEKTVSDALEAGVVIVVSKPAQRMDVFANGKLWSSSPVSTGKRGKETPSGTFAILQKKPFHRSNIYSNAPMPFMQRLTWDGIAIHSGHVPGYPASHGCIRIPDAFARRLFELTGFTTTGVIVSDEDLATEADALRLAQATAGPIPIDPAVLDPKWAEAIRVAEEDRAARATPLPEADKRAARNGEEVIQLAASLSEGEASAHWDRIVSRQPDLAQMRKEIESAVVGGQRFYRLRAHAKGAHERCRALAAAGIACFAVS